MIIQRKLGLMLTLIVVAVLAWTQPAAARTQGQTPVSQFITWSLSELNEIDSLRLEGYRPAASFSLTLPPGWQPAADGQLLLDYHLSELASPESSLTVRLNNQNIHSVSLTEFTGSLRFDLPANYLGAGRNDFDLLAYLPLEDETECTEPNHPARWLAIDANSQINLSLEPISEPLHLAEFPQQIRSFDDYPAFEMNFVLPDQPDQDELNALSAVAFTLASDHQRDASWRVFSQHEFHPDALSGSVVLIGAAGRNSLLDDLAPGRQSRAGWLSLTRPQWSNGHPVLAIGGPDGPAVLKAARGLADPVARLQMNSDLAVIDALPDLVVGFLPDSFTLADLGYGQRTVRGTGQQSLVFTLDIPFSWRLERGRLALRFAHSTLLHPDLGALTVYLNGYTVADLILNAPDSALNTVEFTLPEAILRPGRNFLRLTFEFGQPIEVCGFESDQEPWGTVNADTRISLPHSEQGGRLDLGDYPYHLASESDLSHLVIVLPDKPHNDDFIDALAIIRSLRATRSRIAPRLLPGSILNEADKSSHLIVLGEISRQPLLIELNPFLPLPFDFAGNRQLPDYGIRLPETASSLGILQLLRSPWQANRMVLVASGEGSVEYRRALEMLVHPVLQTALADQLLWLTPGTREGSVHVHTQTLPDLAAIPGMSWLDRLLALYLADQPALATIGLVAIALIVLAIVITLGSRWYRLRQGTTSGA